MKRPEKLRGAGQANYAHPIRDPEGIDIMTRRQRHAMAHFAKKKGLHAQPFFCFGDATDQL
ncbi:hypothetical protein [Denitromonas sp.]|uniref:hypothetical protein n=1 Tax=Denitromonas sp. TaxID=2734609 RepID=UPI003A88284F